MCQEFGSVDALPADCETSCVENGELLLTFDCIRCRGVAGLRLEGLGEDLQAGLPFDPSRVSETINEIVAGLNQDGEQCLTRVAESVSLMRTRLKRWRDDNPSQEEENPDELVIKSVADIQAELNDMAESSARLEDEFAADEAGEAFRANIENAPGLLQERISDDNRPNACAAEFDALKESYNGIVDEYAALPQRLQEQGVERVSIGFEDTDIGSTDLTDGSSVCGFAQNLADKLKTAADNHKIRLEEAQQVVCLRAGEMIKSGKLNDVTTCLRDAKQAADESGDAAAQQAIADDIAAFDNNGFENIDNLVRLMANKCLMRETEESPLTRIENFFKGRLSTVVAKNDGSELTNDEMGAIATRISTAVQDQHPNARNIETTFGDTTAGRRQLRPRRLNIAVMTSYDMFGPPMASRYVDNVDLGADLDNAFTLDVAEDSFDVSPASVAMTAPIANIDTELPTGEGTGGDGGSNSGGNNDGGSDDGGSDDGGSDDDGNDVTDTPPTRAASGAESVVFGAAAAIATLLFV